MEHADCDQIIVDITCATACVHVNRVEHRHKVLLTQSIDVITDNELETTEATSHNLVTLMLEGLADRHDDYTPSFIFYLLPARLYDFLKALDHC